MHIRKRFIHSLVIPLFGTHTKQNGDILIKGGKIQMKGSKDIIIKGKKIAQN